MRRTTAAFLARKIDLPGQEPYRLGNIVKRRPGCYGSRSEEGTLTSIGFTQSHSAMVDARELKDLGNRGMGFILIIIGALMLASGVARYVAEVDFLFAGTDPAFVGIVGLIALILGSSLLDK